MNEIKTYTLLDLIFSTAESEIIVEALLVHWVPPTQKAEDIRDSIIEKMGGPW